MESLRNAEDYRVVEVEVPGGKSIEVGVGTVLLYKAGSRDEISGTSLNEIKKFLNDGNKSVDSSELRKCLAGVVYGSKPDDNGEKKPQFILMDRVFTNVEHVVDAVQRLVSSAFEAQKPNGNGSLVQLSQERMNQTEESFEVAVNG